MSIIIRDSHEIAYPATLFLVEDTTSGGELPLGSVSSASDLESALTEVEQQGCTTKGWYVSGEDADGTTVRLWTM